MTHVASEATRANHSGVITAPSFVSGNEHATAKPGQARADVPTPRWRGPGQSVLKKPTLMVWLPLRSRANTSSS
jgi:hypothetical protein